MRGRGGGGGRGGRRGGRRGGKREGEEGERRQGGKERKSRRGASSLVGDCQRQGESSRARKLHQLECTAFAEERNGRSKGGSFLGEEGGVG